MALFDVRAVVRRLRNRNYELRQLLDRFLGGARGGYVRGCAGTWTGPRAVALPSSRRRRAYVGRGVCHQLQFRDVDLTLFGGRVGHGRQGGCRAHSHSSRNAADFDPGADTRAEKEVMVLPPDRRGSEASGGSC